MSELNRSNSAVFDPTLDAGDITPLEKLSLQRIELLSETSQELRAAIPDYMGMTLFGSTARGEARPDSDVDIFAFIKVNPESPAQQSHFDWGKGKEIETVPKGAGFGVGTVNFAPYLDVHRTQIEERIRSKGIEKIGLIKLPISEEIIDETSDMLLTMAQKFSETGSTDAPPRNIRALFHVPIDVTQLQPYIDQTLSKLESSPYGEIAWSLIRQMVNGFENGRVATDLRVVTHRHLPETLEDARKYYIPSDE